MPNENVAKVLAAVRDIVGLPPAGQQTTADRLVITALTEAWAEAIREEWRATVRNNPMLVAMDEIAAQMMQDDGYQMEDPIVLPPGFVPYTAKACGNSLLCINFSMAVAMPLSAFYVSQVRSVFDAVEKIEVRKQESEAGKPTDSAEGGGDGRDTDVPGDSPRDQSLGAI